jgi:hypothetical protein
MVPDARFQHMDDSGAATCDVASWWATDNYNGRGLLPFTKGPRPLDATLR